jgi:uncharacterized protein (TIGR03435 family)
MLLHKQHLLWISVLSVGVAAAQPAFEVASVRQSAESGGRFTLTGGPGTSDPGRITYTNVPLRRVLLIAYDFSNHQILGPDWLNTLRYDITAKVQEGATKEQFQAMLRSLLIARFQMAIHQESRELSIYSLLIAKGGPRIKPATETASADEQLAEVKGEGRDGFPVVQLRSPGMVIETRNGQARSTAKEVSMAKFADFLTGQVGRPVIDRTGLAATYSFALYFTPQGAVAADDTQPGIFAGLQEQLGLKLEPGRGPVELLIVDRAEKVPTEN